MKAAGAQYCERPGRAQSSWKGEPRIWTLQICQYLGQPSKLCNEVGLHLEDVLCLLWKAKPERYICSSNQEHKMSPRSHTLRITLLNLCFCFDLNKSMPWFFFLKIRKYLTCIFSFYWSSQLKDFGYVRDWLIQRDGTYSREILNF